MDVFDKINDQYLTDDLLMISEACGIDAVRKLLRNFGGISFYIPKLTRLDDFVLHYMNEHKYKTLKEIAKDLNVSEQFLKSLKKKSTIH